MTFTGRPPGSRYLSFRWTTRSLILIGRLRMRCYTPWTASSLLVMPLILLASVPHLWRPLPICFMSVPWRKVSSPGSNLSCSGVTLCCLPYRCGIFFLASLRTSWFLSRGSLFISWMSVSSSSGWLGMTHFRDTRPGAIVAIGQVKARVAFYLRLYFKRFCSARSKRYFQRQWCASGTLGSLGEAGLSISW